MEIRLDKLAEYIKEEKIMEFENNVACAGWFNTNDFQNIKNAEELKALQGIYGFNIGTRRYHILVDEALDVYKKEYKFSKKGIEEWYDSILDDCLEEKEKMELEIKVSVNGKEISIPTLADNIEIIYGAIMECRENTVSFTERRKVLITHGMSSDKMLIITDATKERIEECCGLESTQEYGIGHAVDCLKEINHVKELFDSELDDMENIDIIGYDEVYDLSDYTE